MKTKTQVLLEDIVSAGKDIMKNNFLIPPPKGTDRGGFFPTVFFDIFVGGLIGSYIASQDGDWRNVELGVIYGSLYGCLAPVVSQGIGCLRDSIKDYMNSLETRAKGYDNSKR